MSNLWPVSQPSSHYVASYHLWTIGMSCVSFFFTHCISLYRSLSVSLSVCVFLSGKLFGELKHYFNIVCKNCSGLQPDVSLYGFLYERLSLDPEPTESENPAATPSPSTDWLPRLQGPTDTFWWNAWTLQTVSVSFWDLVYRSTVCLVFFLPANRALWKSHKLSYSIEK